MIYNSRCNGNITWDQVKSILHASEKSNTEHEISGGLLATAQHFLQIIEGRFEDVNQTFMRIARDPRHRDTQLVSFNCVDARLFGGWGMRGIGVFDFNQDLARQLMEKYGEEKGGAHFPLEEWLVLAMINDIRTVREPPGWKRSGKAEL